jgi:methylisocitrate lyase
MKKTTMLRRLLGKTELAIAPSVYDCMSARMAQLVGFKMLFMSEYAVRETQLGMPDIGISTLTELVNIVRNMVNSVDIPLFIDGDDGYGGALAAYRMTQEIVRAGAAGMFIEDQKHPTKCPAIGVQEILPRNEFLGKMGAVLEARDKADKDFVVCARIDAAATLGVEEMLERVKACLELGVDMIFPQHIALLAAASGKNVKETFKQYYTAIGAPNVWIFGIGPPYDFSAKDYREMGAKLFASANPLPPVAKTLIDMYKSFYNTGSQESFSPPGIPSNEILNKVGKLEFWNELENKYVITKNI